MTAADTEPGKKKKEYMELVKLYESQEEWMAYKEIPSTLIELATTYTRKLVNLNKKSAVEKNGRWADGNTFGSQQPFPESMNGCPSLEQLKSLFGACRLG